MLQQSLFLIQPSPAIAEKMVPSEKGGVVYTKPWVVRLILDLSGYGSELPLYQKLLIEPSVGDGAFLLEAIRRLVESCQRFNHDISECTNCIVGFEIDPATVQRCRSAIVETLLKLGVSEPTSQNLATSWLTCGDYLLEANDYIGLADFVVGNPPYIRLEDMDRGGATYRESYLTMVGRADIYVAFYEAGLRQLKPGGVCGYICADRWMYNQYGSELRKFITADYCVESVLEMHHAQAFESEVSAYPAITIVRRGRQGEVLFGQLNEEAGTQPPANLVSLLQLVRLHKGSQLGAGVSASTLGTWFKGDEPWPMIEPQKMALLKRLEADFPTLENAGVTVGIGVATGADKIFITKRHDQVEPDLLLKLAMASDVKGANVEWSGHYLVNPWNRDGLVDLRSFPRLNSLFEKNRSLLQARHVGKKGASTWFRTIDRVNIDLTQRPKLYLPDIQARIAPVLDRGETYPHHNLYYMVSNDWDLEVLGGILLSDVAQFFVEAYGVRMRGGYLRFQAQYLRRIRIPSPRTISEEHRQLLKEAFSSRSVQLSNTIVAELYKLTEDEKLVIGC